jgi:hypothetical protein
MMGGAASDDSTVAMHGDSATRAVCTGIDRPDPTVLLTKEASPAAAAQPADPELGKRR